MKNHSVLLALLCLSATNADLQVGVGIYDATGPISDVLMMGMANPKQFSAGLHQRLRARSFVAKDDVTGKLVAFCSLDAGMSGIVLKNRVMKELSARFPGVYTDANVAISGTHTHSGPSGFLQDTIFLFAGSGWVPTTINAYVTAVVESISMAHNNLGPVSGVLTVGELDDANINRSPTSYLQNPAEERAKYQHDTDHNMSMVKFVKNVAGVETPVAIFNWFAVHPTSMNNTNVLVSGDNKGYASYLFEQWVNGPTSKVKPGQGEFVAAFAATNLGDVSPNTAGPHCRDTGESCDNDHSTCNGRNEQCSSAGPGKDMFESCAIIGQKQFAKAQELYNMSAAASVPLVPQGQANLVDYIHTYVEMPGLNVTDPTSGAYVGSLCKAAMGDSFAAGTTDGPGAFDFTQGANSTNPLWPFIVDLIHKPTPEERACQAPKDILLPTGSISVPHTWGPSVLPVQILRVGQLVMLIVPTEVTTMAGRRMRDQLKATLVAQGIVGPDAMVVIAGLANGYADYTTTYEEYQHQRYEAGSTIFGPHQLNAYINILQGLVKGMASGKGVPAGPTPEDFSSKLWAASAGANCSTSDNLPKGATAYGQVLTQPLLSYTAGTDVASVTFAGSDPINNAQVQGSYFEVQMSADASDSSWSAVAVDSDWETRLMITKTKVGFEEHARVWTVEWHIPATAAAGKYRIVVKGSSCKHGVVASAYAPFTGTTITFSVAAAAH